MFPATMTISGFDPELQAALDGEKRRQEDHIELIASENYASPRVLEAQGTVLTNKYAEGYPGKRYYGGSSGRRSSSARPMRTYNRIRDRRRTPRRTWR